MSTTDLITISSSALPSSARVVGFRGGEAISRPYQYDIFFAVPSDDGELDLAGAIGAKATLVIDRASDNIPPYVFAGVLASVELLHEVDGRALLRAVLVPRLWRLTLSKHSRMFTKKSVPAVIKAILEDNDITSSDYEMLLGNYEPEEHICQYRESDFDFISRWMEREGIFYYFEHSEEGEKLILCDDSAYPSDAIGKPVRYYPQLGHDRSAGSSFRTFACKHSTLPAMVKLKDYDYAKPSLDVTGSSPVVSNGAGEVSLYGERFFTPAAGKRLAKLRSEELLTRKVVYHATGTRLHLRSGYTFELEEHPRSAFNIKYLVIEAQHYGNQAAGHAHFKDLLGLEHDDVYFADVTAIPESTQFRAEQRTPWPRIYSFENGTVDGAASSEYAQIDGQGRYLVKLHFDESDLQNGGASTYVRMMQPHGGGIEGFHFPLRKGTEVVLSFLGGDPDRPVISGVVPNTLTPSPVTSGNHTKNVIQTGGRNRLELEDLAGQQRVTMSTPYSNTYLRMGSPNDGHELIVKTDDNSLLDSGKNFDLRVGVNNGGGTWDVEVQDDVITDVMAGDVTTTIHAGDVSTTVTAGAMTTTVKQDLTTTVQSGNMVTHVDAGFSETKVKGDTTITVESGNTKIDTQAGTTEVLSKGNITVKSASGDITIDAETGKMTIHAATGIDIKSEGDISVNGAQKWYQYTTGDYFKFNVSSVVSLTLGLTSETKVALTNENFIGGKISTMVGGTMELNAAYKFAVNAAISLEYKFGAALCINNAVELTIKPVRIKTGTAAIEQLPTRLAMSALRYHLSGVHVLS